MLEHAAAWVETGHALVAADDAPSAVEVFVNPNNPDGRLYPHDELLQSAGRCAAAGGFAVVDEAFADVAPEAALDASANTPGLVILRSVGKFFGLPGLRIGFALGDPATIERLRRAMGPWAVSGPALELAAAALADAAWIDETRTRLRALRRRLDEVLSGAGLELLGGTDLFRLVRHEEAGAVCGHLGGKGILVRTFDYAPEWLRFGLPGDDIGFERLSKALASCGR